MSGLLLCKARALGLCNATLTFLKHILVAVNLLEPHTVQCTTPTYPSLYLLVITDICVTTYPQYINSTNLNMRLGFSYPGHIWVKSGSNPDCYLSCQIIRVSSCYQVSTVIAVMTGQKDCLWEDQL